MGRASDKFKTLEEHIRVLDKAFNVLDQLEETLAQDTDSIAVEQASGSNILLDNWTGEFGASVYKASRISKRSTANSQLTCYGRSAAVSLQALLNFGIWT